MVLQRGQSANIFGSSSAGDVVTVSLNGQKYQGTTNNDGQWSVAIASQPASATGTSVAIASAAGGAATFADVLFGDVYLAVGEGNLLMTASSVFGGQDLIASAANYPTIRLAQAAPTPVLPWTPASPAVVGAGNWTTYSAVAYAFAKNLVDALGSSVPIGVIVVGAGGSPLQAWCGPATLAACPAYPPPAKYATSSLFSSLLAPLAAGPFAATGIVLWQGESNSAMAIDDSTAAWYECALPALLAEVRAALAAPNLWVGVVSLPPLAAQFWTDLVPRMRDSQRLLSGPHTAVIPTVDLGDINADYTWVHGRNKTAVAQRLANAALNQVYGKSNSPYLPPANPAASFASADPKTNITTVTVSFNDNSMAAPLWIDASIVCPGGFPEGDPNNLWLSYVCQYWRVRSDARDGFKWYNAIAATVNGDGKTVSVTVQLPAPGIGVTMIEYAYAPWTASNLYDANGLPVWPFQANISGSPPSAASLFLEESQSGEAQAHTNGRKAGGRKLQSWLNLEANKWLPLPLGSIQAQGWLKQQLIVEVTGMTGSLATFYPPVAYSPWIVDCGQVPGGCQDTNEGEDFAYWFQAAVPLALQTDTSCSGAFCMEVSGYVTHILQTADNTTGWIGPASDPGDGNAEWARWPVLIGLLQWYEGTKDARILPAIYKHLHESYRRLSQHAPLSAWAASRWQDYIWFIQALMDTDPQDVNGQKTFLTSHMWLVAGQQGVVWETWFSPSFPGVPQGNTGWNFSTHGVNTAEGLKSGAVLYRMTSSPYALQSSRDRMAFLDTYHGAPTGTFFADETLADSMPSHGSELCLVVESIFSLNVMHEALGDAAFADRAEKVAYNALPGTWGADMWSHQYLQQPNSPNAITSGDHIWLADGPDATTFGLAPNYPCCTANGPQGWPRFVPRMVHASADGGVALSLLGPLTATVPLQGPNAGSTVTLSVVTDYPFGDFLDITVSGVPASGLPFYVRVPAWATAANLTVDVDITLPLGVNNGTMYLVNLATAGTHTLHYELNPSIYIDSVGVLWNGAVAVHRGPLVYGLHLDTYNNITAAHNCSDPNHPIVYDYEVIQTNQSVPWNVALVLDPASPSSSLFFERSGKVNTTLPFDHAAPPMLIHAMAREIPGWKMVHNAPDVPPSSPACPTPDACGAAIPVSLYPYGFTATRMTVLPWTPQ